MKDQELNVLAIRMSPFDPQVGPLDQAQLTQALDERREEGSVKPSEELI